MNVVPSTSRPAPRAARSRLISVWSLLLLASCLLLGCSDDPTTPEDQRLFVFSSQLTDGGSVVHEVTFPTDGTLRMTMEDISPVLLDTTAITVEALLVQFELARRFNGECQNPTARLSFRDNQVFLIDIASTEYCFTISDPGLLPDGSTVLYRLVVELEE